MGLDREKVLASAEKQLKTGRGPAALVELRKLTASAAHDVTLLNRVGDLLARHDVADGAIEFYSRAADVFVRTGLFPKAIALGKKILRLDPDRIDTLVQIGEWYLEQRLPGEARPHLLHAADKCLDRGEYARARAVYERLVAAEPRDPRHRARLAEALASEGRTAEAGDHLLALARTIRSGAGSESREGVYRRAMELLPDRDEPVLGLVATLVEAGREQDAVDCLEARRREGAVGPALAAELAVLHDAAGRGDEALTLLASIPASELPDDALERVLRARIARGDAAGFWGRMGERLAPSVGEPDATAVRVRILEKLADLEPSGHAPALRTLLAWHDSAGTDPDSALLERLHGALEAAGEVEAAREILDRLTAPDATGEGAGDIPADRPGPPSPGGAETKHAEDVRNADAPAAADRPRVPLAAEAPAVPLNRTDEEFVGGRITQAEILEKYGLRDKAVEQVREVVSRFPGHVDAQRRLVRLTEDGGSAADLRDALVGLALALRAAGDAAGAREAARTAAESAPLEDQVVAVLVALGLRERRVDASDGPTNAAIEDADTVELVEDPVEAAEDPGAFEIPSEPEPVVARAVQTDDDEVEVVVDFDDFPSAEASAPTAPPPGAPVAPVAEDPPVERSVVGPVADEPGSDDLADLARALESELFDDADEEPLLPEAPQEQSLDEVLDAFRARVREEVADDDHRMRYDLAIGYKEMGMLDEAVSEFEVTAASPELALESCVMIAVIRREQGDLADAARWYRRALDSSERSRETVPGLRYDLADTLERAGEVDEALRVFRDLSTLTPSFRDVDTRISAIESRRPR